MKCTICAENIDTYLPLTLGELKDNLCNACVIWGYYTINMLQHKKGFNTPYPININSSI